MCTLAFKGEAKGTPVKIGFLYLLKLFYNNIFFFFLKPCKVKNVTLALCFIKDASQERK